MAFASQADRTGNVAHVELEENVKHGYVLFGGDNRNENMGWIHKNWPIPVATPSKAWV